MTPASPAKARRHRKKRVTRKGETDARQETSHKKSALPEKERQMQDRRLAEKLLKCKTFQKLETWRIPPLHFNALKEKVPIM